MGKSSNKKWTKRAYNYVNAAFESQKDSAFKLFAWHRKFWVAIGKVK